MSNAHRENIDNLTGFWRSLGTTTHPLPGGARLAASTAWPHRRWVDWGTELDARQVAAIVELVRDDASAVVPVWGRSERVLGLALDEAGLLTGFQLLAMRRPRAPWTTRRSHRLRLLPVATPALADEWARAASASFGYFVEPAVIQGALTAPDLRLMIARQGDAAVGTVLLFEDEHVTGVHMMGVVPSHRRQGHARSIMHDVLVDVGSERDLVLQASAAGEPLYRSMGFERQFPIPHHVARATSPAPPESETRRPSEMAAAARSDCERAGRAERGDG